MGRVTFVLFTNVLQQTVGGKITLDKRRAGLLRQGYNVVVKSRWRWGQPRYNIRLEPVFLVSYTMSAPTMHLKGIYCAARHIPNLPRGMFAAG